jgi:hypothetical protein
MTFKEWWKEKALKMIVLNYGAEEIAHDAWQAAQPKWTYCKDGMPKEKDGKVITTHETDASFYSHEIKVIRVYVKLETQNPFNETRIDNFCLSTNKFEKYEDLVIAWMPLPEAPAEINSGFNKQGVHI